MTRARHFQMLFYRSQPDQFGDAPVQFLDDDSLSDDPPLPLPIASAILADRKRAVPPAPGLWLWTGDGYRRLSEVEAVDLAMGRLKLFNPMRRP